MINFIFPPRSVTECFLESVEIKLKVAGSQRVMIWHGFLSASLAFLEFLYDSICAFPLKRCLRTVTINKTIETFKRCTMTYFRIFFMPSNFCGIFNNDQMWLGGNWSLKPANQTKLSIFFHFPHQPWIWKYEKISTSCNSSSDNYIFSMELNKINYRFIAATIFYCSCRIFRSPKWVQFHSFRF